ncbi:MAG TPA: hypothetical protein VM935_12735, partial [Chitinophagaceae bacterium]|nr:hypothetical protein [Chitinophagaceae bacterium]
IAFWYRNSYSFGDNMDKFYIQLRTGLGIKLFSYKGLHSSTTQRYQVSVAGHEGTEYFTITKKSQGWMFERPEVIPNWIREVEKQVLFKKDD